MLRPKESRFPPGACPTHSRDHPFPPRFEIDVTPHPRQIRLGVGHGEGARAARIGRAVSQVRVLARKRAPTERSQLFVLSTPKFSINSNAGSGSTTTSLRAISASIPRKVRLKLHPPNCKTEQRASSCHPPPPPPTARRLLGYTPIVDKNTALQVHTGFPFCFLKLFHRASSRSAPWIG
jgi:hypothetical protein